MLFSFPCLKPCTWDWVESKSKKIEVVLYPANNPLETLEWSLDEVDSGENCGHLSQQTQNPHLTSWNYQNQHKMLCVQENNKSTLEIQSNCHLFLKQCHLSRILYSPMLNPDVHSFGKCATPALDRLSWSAALRLPSFSLSNTFDTSLSRCKCYNLKSLHLLFSIWIIRGLLP